MVAIGNFLFHHRNYLFPLFYLALFLPSPMLMHSFSIPALIGLAVCVAGMMFRAVTLGQVDIIRGGRDRRIHAKELIREGVYTHCRNPLYIGNILILTGMGIMANSLLFMVVCVPLFVFFYQAIVRAEEHFLTGQFGDQYRAYLREVNRWAPRLAGIRGTFRTIRVRWKRVIVKEYNQAYISFSGVLFAMMKNLSVNDHDAFERAIPFGIGVFAFFTVAYLVLFYLKKTKRLTA